MDFVSCLLGYFVLILIGMLVSVSTISFNNEFLFSDKILSLYNSSNDDLSLFINLLAKSSIYFIEISFLKSKLNELF